ncbi:MAG: hypothetical protein OXC68_03970 [Aestuariivita sp.]|nr:hypothetical protein [Aestuariivita sp.]
MTNSKKTIKDKLDPGYQPSSSDMQLDVSVSVTPEELAQAVLKGGADRCEKQDN